MCLRLSPLNDPDAIFLSSFPPTLRPSGIWAGMIMGYDVYAL